MAGYIKSAGRHIVNFIFPIECLGCELAGDLICDTCIKMCGGTPELVCANCGLRSPVGLTHPKCQTSHGIDGIFSAGSFHTPLVQLAIRYLKYKNVQNLSLPLAKMINERLAAEFPNTVNDSELVTYVPMHPAKQRKRGYNQSELLAAQLARLLDKPLLNTIFKSRETQDQVLLDRNNRQENIKGAFELAPGSKIKGKNFLLVDDVCTTGATLKECAKVLKRNGANFVMGVTVAKD